MLRLVAQDGNLRDCNHLVQSIAPDLVDFINDVLVLWVFKHRGQLALFLDKVSLEK